MRFKNTYTIEESAQNKLRGSHTYTPPTPPCRRTFTEKRGLLIRNPGYVTAQPRTNSYTVSHQTEDVMWLGAIQPRMLPYTFNRGHVLNSIFTSFSSFYTPLRTEHRPQFSEGPRSPVRCHVRVLVWRRLSMQPSHTQTFCLFLSWGRTTNKQMKQ